MTITRDISNDKATIELSGYELATLQAIAASATLAAKPHTAYGIKGHLIDCCFIYENEIKVLEDLGKDLL